MTVRRSMIWVVVMLAAMVVLDLVRGESTPGWSAVFGLVACATWIVVTKWVGTRWLWRDAPGEDPGVVGRGDG